MGDWRPSKYCLLAMKMLYYCRKESITISLWRETDGRHSTLSRIDIMWRDVSMLCLRVAVLTPSQNVSITWMDLGRRVNTCQHRSVSSSVEPDMLHLMTRTNTSVNSPLHSVLNWIGLNIKWFREVQQETQRSSKARLVDQGLTSHQTHYRSYRGRVFTSQVTQPTMS